jgi:cytoskeletal protein CcmA (bactofilin family)
MALIQADRVKETSSTTGTGNFTLAGATTGFRRFNDGVGSANTCYYVITDNTDYEIGLGTLSNSATLARTTVITSSNSNSAVDWGAGTKDVFTTYPGTKAVIQDANGEVSLGSALGVFGAVSVGGTLAVTGDTDVANLSASGTFDVAGTTNLATATITGTLAVSSNASVGGTFKITGGVSANSTLNVGSNVSVDGTLNVEGDIKNNAGNLTLAATSYIVEVKGGGSTDAELKLNCRSNSHGQTIKSQEHSVGVTNTMLLPLGANSTLVSEIGTATVTHKTIDAAVSVSAAGAITSGTVVSDVDGNLRDIPLSTKVSGAYTLQISDAGNQITVNSSNVVLTVPDSVFAVGDIVSIISVNGCTATIACTAVNAVKAGELEATALHTLDANGVASIMFSYTADLAVLTGNVS